MNKRSRRKMLVAMVIFGVTIAAVLAEVHRVPKNGRNDFHKYDYVTESDLVDHLREKLAEQDLTALVDHLNDSYYQFSK